MLCNFFFQFIDFQLGLIDLNYMIVYIILYIMYICIYVCIYLMIVFYFISLICILFMYYTLIRVNLFYRFFYIKCILVVNGCVICSYNYINYLFF